MALRTLDPGLEILAPVRDEPRPRAEQVAYLQARGLQNLEARTPMTARSLFRIYSMTKPVTAVAAMMLWEERRFQLDEPVSKYLPDFAKVRVQDAQTRTTRASGTKT